MQSESRQSPSDSLLGLVHIVFGEKSLRRSDPVAAQAEYIGVFATMRGRNAETHDDAHATAAAHDPGRKPHEVSPRSRPAEQGLEH